MLLEGLDTVHEYTNEAEHAKKVTKLFCGTGFAPFSFIVHNLH